MKLRKKQDKSKSIRQPNIVRQKQSTFQYSSNRHQREGHTQRDALPVQEGSGGASRKINSLSKFAKVQYLAVFIALLLLMFYLSLITGNPKVTVENDTKMVRSSSEYSEALSEMTNGFMQKSKFGISKQALEEEFMNRFPEVGDVKVTTPIFSSSVNADLVISEPTIVMNANSGSYLISENGIAVLDLGKDQPSFDVLSLPQISDQSGVDISVGKPALISSQVNFIKEIRHQADAKGLSFESVSLLGGGSELHVKFGGLPYIVKFNLNEDSRLSFGTFVATKDHLDQSGDSVTEYIDVRIVERAYVK